MRLLQGMKLRVDFWLTDRADRSFRQGPDGAQLPPASLRHRVHGVSDRESFLAVGQQCAADILKGLERLGHELSSMKRALDFGCGCGRTLVPLARRAGTTELYGTDIDDEAIAWCRKSLGFARFGVNQALPPLDYPPDHFDLVYGISVFTHLDAGFQEQWLGELRRVAKPGGAVLLTVHGPSVWRRLAPQHAALVEREGFLFLESRATKGIFPDWYQNAYHAAHYVRSTFGRCFDVVDIVPQGMAGHQDLVIMRRP